METRQELHCFDTTLSALFFKSTSCSHVYQYFLAQLPLKRKGAGLYRNEVTRPSLTRYAFLGAALFDIFDRCWIVDHGQTVSCLVSTIIKPVYYQL